MLNSCDESFLAPLRALLPDGVFRDAEPRHLEEPRGAFTGTAGAVAAPAHVEQVATIVRAANEARVPLVPLGGQTGLVGGQVVPDGPAPLLLSMERMAAVRGVFPEENVLVAEAGAILAQVQDAARRAGRLFPLSLASEGSARIGGLLGTNAGGINVLRYGNARDLCLGLEAVMPSGEIWHGLKRLRKDNTGYDLRNLLVGSEGTLGVITAASLRLFPQPSEKGAALMIVPSPAAALTLLSLARDRVSDGISAFELISGQGLRFLMETMPEVRQPFEAPPDWMVLIDLGLTSGRAPEEELEGLFEAAAEAGLVTDGLVAQSEAQRQDFWRIRESIPEANKRVGAISSHDISLPLSVISDFIAEAGKRLQDRAPCRINCFGHLGDGNLHYNVYPLVGETKASRASEKAEVQSLVHTLVAEMDGSISAEHGIGRLKAADLEQFGDPTKLAAMRAIKAALDPHGIMNPGAVLR